MRKGAVRFTATAIMAGTILRNRAGMVSIVRFLDGVAMRATFDQVVQVHDLLKVLAHVPIVFRAVEGGHVSADQRLVLQHGSSSIRWRLTNCRRAVASAGDYTIGRCVAGGDRALRTQSGCAAAIATHPVFRQPRQPIVFSMVVT
jgi:hypothetical protein